MTELSGTSREKSVLRTSQVPSPTTGHLSPLFKVIDGTTVDIAEPALLIHVKRGRCGIFLHPVKMIYKTAPWRMCMMISSSWRYR